MPAINFYLCKICFQMRKIQLEHEMVTTSFTVCARLGYNSSAAIG